MYDAEIAPGRARAVIGFAGGGGSSVGFRMATGRDPDMAMNHWITAVFAHQRHFPGTEHRCADVFEVDPRTVMPGEHIGFGWFSPDCTDFSKAKGAAPRSERIRGLAWSIIPWALTRRIDVIMLENVEEFLDWGPVYRTGLKSGEPVPARRGETFKRWKSRLEHLGYQVEHRILNAADYGAPTTRKRLFIVARRDGEPVVWPEPTHAPRSKAAKLGLKPWRGACEVIDFSRPCPSIFMTQAEAKAEGLKVRRPLVGATHGRVARGIERYVVGCDDPYIVETANDNAVSGHLIPTTHAGDLRAHGVRDPLRTISAVAGGEFALVTGYMVPRYGERPGQEPRVRDLKDPLATVVPDGNGGSLAAVHLHRQFGSTVSGRSVREPAPTAMAGRNAGGKMGVCAAFLGSYYATGIGSPLDRPMRAATAQARHAVTAAWLEQANTGMVGHDARDPVSTIVAGGGGDSNWGGCTQRLIQARLEVEGGDPRRRGQVLEFLWHHFGEPTAEEWADPCATLRARLRFGLVILHGVTFAIVDIGLRMLTPAELAAAMGFPPEYHLAEDALGRPLSKTAQTQMIGNAVSPPVAAALIAANCPGLRTPDQKEAA